MKGELLSKIAEELKKNQELSENLVLKILNSKRLLVDHVETLEECLGNINNANEDGVVVSVDNYNANEKAIKNAINNKLASKEVFTGPNACLMLGTTILQHFFVSKRFVLIPSIILTTGFGACYMLKKAFVFRNRLVELQLEKLINSIDTFANSIRRNMTYFNEIIVLKKQEQLEAGQIERAWDCITSTKEVTFVLYHSARELESQYPLPNVLRRHYMPMEDLSDCEYFKNNLTHYHAKHIKDFYNIFAYAQSQYLFRLGLTFLTHPSAVDILNSDMLKVECVIRQLVQEEEQNFRNMTFELIEQKQLESDTLHRENKFMKRSEPLAMLQDCSLKLSARMVAVAGECQSLDFILQGIQDVPIQSPNSTTNLLQMTQNMRTIENALSVCFDDFQRLTLVYNKFLKKIVDPLDDKSERNSSSEENNLLNEDGLEVQTSFNKEPQDDSLQYDDFFAYFSDARSMQNENIDNQGPESEILNFEKRITKGKFKPVLEQLKTRIEPIRQDMLEKERDVLAAKGLDVDDFILELQRHRKPLSIEDRKETKPNKYYNKYDNERKLLEQCNDMERMRLPMPTPFLPSIAGREDVLESDC